MSREGSTNLHFDVKMWVVVNERAMIAAFEAATQARVAAIGAAQPCREPQHHELRARMVQ